MRKAYEAIRDAYGDLGRSEEILRHHQGGPTGYLSREEVSGPHSLSSGLPLRAHMAFAWNPSVPGAKIEDTVLLTEQGIEVLTVSEGWPTRKVGRHLRPEILIKT